MKFMAGGAEAGAASADAVLCGAVAGLGELDVLRGVAAGLGEPDVLRGVVAGLGEPDVLSG